MAIENEQEVIDYLKKEENKEFLSKNGFMTEVEKQVKTPLTDEEVKGYLAGKPDMTKEVGANAIQAFLKEKLGKEVTEEELKQGLVLGGTLENVKKLAVGKILSGVKYGDLLMSKIDFSKIQFKEDKIEGLDEQLTSLKTQYKDLFEPATTGGGGTPPSVAKKEPQTDLEKVNQELEELKNKGQSVANRAKIMMLLNKKAELEKGE
ncbi:phage scaffolding protein [Fusobacterium necrophorum]|uniref:Phage scaffolding protein n=1 Tax=Fusobacterium necrophorum TaxID=859 RepID=A0AAW6WDV4_9FUSO|nr:phage scaffolding protein [Fusobacterium necrophorum]MDK4481698.1 phage scaffolding protein [Fusobacterium necrophorum]MDK4512763.1 phage scaffolding protein [Fusobacterium necrophorum]